MKTVECLQIPRDVVIIELIPSSSIVIKHKCPSSDALSRRLFLVLFIWESTMRHTSCNITFRIKDFEHQHFLWNLLVQITPFVPCLCDLGVGGALRMIQTPVQGI